MNQHIENLQKKRVNLKKSVLALRIIRFLYLDSISTKGKNKRLFGEIEIAEQLGIKLSQANLYLRQMAYEYLISREKVEGANRKGGALKYFCYSFEDNAMQTFLNWEPLKARFTPYDFKKKKRFVYKMSNAILKSGPEYGRVPFINKLTLPLLKELLQKHLPDKFIVKHSITLEDFYHLFSAYVFKNQKRLLKQCSTKKELNAAHRLVNELITGQLGERYRLIDKKYLRFS